MAEHLLELVLKRDMRAIAQAMSFVENTGPERFSFLERLHPYTGNSYFIGITGPPGSGKSSLLDHLITQLRAQGFSVGVIAIDPSSLFSQGALLGDRVRMNHHSMDDQVFVRSVGSRGRLGGMASAAYDMAKILDAARFDYIIFETVGVGQVEVDIIYAADTVCVVLMPGTGDVVQVFKSGIMEIADIFILNKADLPGYEQLAVDISDLIHVTSQKEWQTSLVKSIAIQNKGIDELVEAIDRHKAYLIKSNHRHKRMLERWRREVELSLHELLKLKIDNKLDIEIQKLLEESAVSQLPSPRKFISERIAFFPL